MPNWTAELLSAGSSVEPVPQRGRFSGASRVYVVLILVEAVAVIAAPWVTMGIASVHGHSAHWNGDFRTSIYHGLLVDFFAGMGLFSVLKTSAELERRISVAADEEQANFLDGIRYRVVVLTQCLFFLALLLSGLS